MSESTMTPFQQAVANYVDNGVTSEKEAIASFKRWKPLSEAITVYRGQPKKFLSPHRVSELFSVTTDPTVANTFSIQGGKTQPGCIWTIELQKGIGVINVAEVLKGHYLNKYNWEKELLVETGQEMTVLHEYDKDGVCYITATYSPRKLEPIYYVGKKPPRVPYVGENGKVYYGGKRRKTRRRKMTRKYCKKTPCRKMGFTQRASCRPYKNCY